MSKADLQRDVDQATRVADRARENFHQCAADWKSAIAAYNAAMDQLRAAQAALAAAPQDPEPTPELERPRSRRRR